MELKVQRDYKTSTATMGVLYLDGQPAGFTLELPVRDGAPGSAIPLGRYWVALYDSPHFGRKMPLITGIPGRSEIEIHWGNDVVDTRGCVLVGRERDTSRNEIYNTRAKFDELFPAIQAAVEENNCWITVEDVCMNNHDTAQEASAT